MCDRASRLWLARRPDASSVWVSAAVPRGARSRPPPWGAGSRGARGERLGVGCSDLRDRAAYGSSVFEERFSSER